MRTILWLTITVLFISCSSSDTPYDYVDPFIGTGGHGHTYPGATLPFGMVQLSPDTRLEGWDGCSGYHYSDSIIYGFSHTHLSGTGVSDYGDILLMPYSGDTHFNNGADGESGYSSLFRKSTEQAEPGYYRVTLDKHDIDVELTASLRVGFHKYQFNRLEDRKVLVDLSHRDRTIGFKLVQTGPREVQGYRHSKAWAEQQFLYYTIRFDSPIKEVQYNADSSMAALVFGEGSQLQAKVAISPVDEAGSEANLDVEMPHWDFSKVREEAKQVWSDQLSKIRVSGGTRDQKVVFYTALYHTMLAPNLYHDVDGRYRGTDLKVRKDTSFTNHTVFSLWDTYRSTHPLYTLLETERTNQFIRTFIHQYEEGGRLPMWELACNYTGCMIGYHAVPVITDAWVKGIRDYDGEKALEAMIHSSLQNRLGIDVFRKNGLISSDEEPESVSKTLEYAYDDWTIGVMAEALGKDSIARLYYERAQHYKNLLDPETGFMRARNNNRWFYPFDPAEVNFNYTEANAWQYSFYVPQDLETWIDLLGGPTAAEEKLDDIFTASSKTTGRDQADITGLIGQYAHGNEPSHHIPYLYNFVGRPDKTQKLVRQIMNELYSPNPDGLSGNEDCGQMSSWLVFSALGFYPVTPGSEDYILGSPWFEEAIILLENGNTFRISASGNNHERVYVNAVELDGQPYSKSYITHSDIVKGGELAFTVSRQSNASFGRKPEDLPTSRIDDQMLAIPAVSAGEKAFIDSTVVILNSIHKDAAIYYAFSAEGSGLPYERPLVLKSSTRLWVWAQRADQRSRKASSSFLRIPRKRAIQLATTYANHYSAGGDNALIDFIRGGRDFRTGTWQGYEGVDLDVTIDLGSRQSVQRLAVGFLQDENAWIFMPEEVTFYGGDDPDNLIRLGSVRSDISYREKGAILKDFSLNWRGNMRFLRVVAKNRGVCPPDHKGAGGKAWIFADEIVIK